MVGVLVGSLFVVPGYAGFIAVVGKADVVGVAVKLRKPLVNKHKKCVEVVFARRQRFGFKTVKGVDRSLEQLDIYLVNSRGVKIGERLGIKRQRFDILLRRGKGGLRAGVVHRRFAVAPANAKCYRQSGNCCRRFFEDFVVFH